MSRINVLVVTASPDLKAEVIAESVASRPDMTLVKGRCVSLAEVGLALEDTPPSTSSALIFVGQDAETIDLTRRWLTERTGLVVMYVDVIDDIVRFTISDPRLDSLLNALRELVEGAGLEGQGRVAHVELRSSRPLLQASIDWVHKLLREAVAQVPDDNGDVHGLSVTRATLLQALDDPSGVRGYRPRDLHEADAVLDAALAAADPSEEPLAAAARGFNLGPLEFRMLVLGLAPELDLRFQRCIGFLLDEMARRVGTFGLYSSLLGSPAQIRGELANAGGFGNWPIFEGAPGQQTAADEPLRLDGFLVQWLLGQGDALHRDPRVRRVLRSVAWSGASLLSRPEERARAAALISRLLEPSPTPWLLLGGTDAAASRALLEQGADASRVRPIRVDTSRLAGVDFAAVEECALRLGRMRQLTGDPIVIDLVRRDDGEADDDSLRLFLTTLGDMGVTSALIGTDEARIVGLLGSAPFELIAESAVPAEAPFAAVRTAANGAGVDLTDEAAEAMMRRFPLHLDGLEHAMALARCRPKDTDVDDPELARFTAACKQVAAEGVSQLGDTQRPGTEAMSALRAYTGVYRLGGDHRLGIDSFISDSGDSTLLFCDYQTGLVRPLFRISPTEFAMGPSFAVRSPVELLVEFQMDGLGAAQGLTLRPTGGVATFATREASRDEEVVFRHGDTTLAGTLIGPATPGPHPAIVLLHGSGPLTRHSFGPWPRFFNSLGMAVLVFDKRGTGASTGVRLDASTGAPATLSQRYYPDDLTDDALAALRFLQGRAEVDRKQIGFWGSSEGGMLATQVAARSNDVAFAIDSSGFMGPSWETLLYQAGALTRARGGPELDVDETMAFTRLWMQVARTGRGYDEFLRRREAIIASGKPWLLSYESAAFTSLEQMRWVWKHILTFSPLPALRRVTAPVLGVWGEADPLTDAPKAANAMREALLRGGNRDVTVHIFPNAGHSLMETPSRRGMASGVFEYLRQWLVARVRWSPAAIRD